MRRVWRVMLGTMQWHNVCYSYDPNKAVVEAMRLVNGYTSARIEVGVKF